jgi:hypothetical protein
MKSIVIVAVVVLAITISVIVYTQRNSLFFHSESDREQACINSGGTIVTQLCCQSVTDFPNSCLIGACGCSQENSHEIKVCECPEDKCFDGSGCVSR